MSASLVGSEMCIRDRTKPWRSLSLWTPTPSRPDPTYPRPCTAMHMRARFVSGGKVQWRGGDRERAWHAARD
eukprot:4786801-Alexandrium_andersonii.AAC.2